ncbi:hypothetical protein PB01_08535 [Psychrobacillus glaciei]|uniref:Uncharacterized protein n=1 Tax=Psychrobacillus glaciei TaxID=2283160 RepID=A0A5J6SLU7_9BACI|nr:hypothetical protein [Psychrobacillus glaciei]QFF98876.1 hypothetical protein PB01_08535 [Psychrobacillus glaciei]
MRNRVYGNASLPGQVTLTSNFAGTMNRMSDYIEKALLNTKYQQSRLINAYDVGIISSKANQKRTGTNGDFYPFLTRVFCEKVVIQQKWRKIN